MSAAELPGCARLELAQGVVPLNPQEAVFEGMLAGWARQQRSRFLREEATIGPRAALVRRLAEFTGPARPRTHAIAELFRSAGVKCHVLDSLAEVRWSKLIWNVPFNGLGVAAWRADSAAVLADRSEERRVGKECR